MAEHSGFQKLVTEAKKHITEISPQDAAAKLNNGDAVVVDVRDKDEWDGEHIPGARNGHLPLRRRWPISACRGKPAKNGL